MEDLKCPHHPQYNIISICETCNKEQPVCVKCITTIHKNHSFFDIEDIDIRNTIISDYNNKTLPQLDSILESCKSKLENSDNHFKQIEDQHNNNFNQLETKFKKLKDIINAKEFDFKRQLLTKLDENRDINTNNSTICNNIITTINNIKKENNNNNNNNNHIDENQFITILKRNYQYKSFAKTTDSLEEYNDIGFKISEFSFSSIVDHVERMVGILKINKESLKDANGQYRWYHLIFEVYENGDNVLNLKNHLLAINYGHHLPPSFPNKVTSLLLPNDFDQPLDSLPFCIRVLFLFNIKLQLKQNTIPQSIESVVFDRGFSQKLNNGIIPDNVKITLYPIEANAVSNPKSVEVYVTISHKHQIPSCYTIVRDVRYLQSTQ